MTETERFSTYEPDNSLKKGYQSLFGEALSELHTNRWLIYQLFKKDFLALYKQSFMGFAWAIVVPLLSVGTFIALNGSGVWNIGAISVPYPLYAILGMAFWQLFSTGIVANSNSLVSAGAMIAKINFSKKSLVVASTGQSLLSFIIQLCLAFTLLLWYHIVPSIAILLFPLLMVPIVLFTLGLGFLLALLNGFMRDIGNLIAVLVTFLMLLTPVLYAKPTTGILATLSTYNILYYLVTVPRDLVLFGTTQNLNAFVLSSVIAAVVFAACLGIFHLTEARIAERI
jgi:lipopolysaccharide transport system permease protein